MADRPHQSDAQQEEKAFLKGFEDEQFANGRTAQPDTATTEKLKDSAEPAKPEGKPASQPQSQKQAQKHRDEFVRLTKPEYEALRTNAGKVPELERRIETAFGKFGPTQQALNDLKATVEALRDATPKGKAIELPADVVSELEADFPDLAGGVKAALIKALKGQVGTGKTEGENGTGEKARFEEWSLERAREDLNETHPDWHQIVGAVDVRKGERADQGNPFRAWLAKQPADYQAKVNGTRNPYVISRAIDRFKASQKTGATGKPQAANPAPQKALLRKNRIQGSVQPKGLGSPPPAQRETVEDAFASGFKNG